MANKWEDTPFKGSMARARGLGSAHAGVHHWMAQRMTAVANIPLVIWAIWSVVTLASAGLTFEAVIGFFQRPMHAILMVLFIVSSFYHAVLGLQVVIEDYVHCEKTKMVSLILLKLAAFGLGIAAIYSLLNIGFEAGLLAALRRA